MLMKYILIVAFILFSNYTFSQSVLKFIDSKTGEPLCGFYSNIYKNGNTFVDCGETDESGFKTIRVRSFDSTATYQVSVTNLKYEPIWQEIDIFQNDTLIIAVEKNDYYIAGSSDCLSQGCSQYSFLNYYPREPRSLTDLPDNIAKKVTAYLKKRVGKNYLDFKLIGGQIIELDEYKKRNPNSKRKTAYYLCFAYRNLELGIAMYSSIIELDKNGKIMKDISFPKSSGKIKLISLSEIKSKAIKNSNYKEGITKITITYLSDSNILAWKFVNKTYNENHTYFEENIIYNAHNGQFIKVDTNKGEWIE